MNFQKETASFKEGLDSDEWREKISKIVDKYDIGSFEASVYYDFDNDKPVLQIKPDDESFRRIIHEFRPKEVQYFGLVPEYDEWDPKGRKGTMRFRESGDVVISSSQYIFGEDGIFENYEKLGYKKEDRKAGMVKTDISHYFVLDEQ